MISDVAPALALLFHVTRDPSRTTPQETTMKYYNEALVIIITTIYIVVDILLDSRSY